MLAWLADNLGTVIVSMMLICVVAVVITGMVRGKKQGKSSCGCGCEHCAMHGKCHTK